MYEREVTSLNLMGQKNVDLVQKMVKIDWAIGWEMGEWEMLFL